MNITIQIADLNMVKESLNDMGGCAVTADIKKIYHAPSEDDALCVLEEFGERWNKKYPQITQTKSTYLSDEAVKKSVYLSIEEISKKWNIPIRDWDHDNGAIQKLYS